MYNLDTIESKLFNGFLSGPILLQRSQPWLPSTDKIWFFHTECYFRMFTTCISR